MTEHFETKKKKKGQLPAMKLITRFCCMVDTETEKMHVTFRVINRRYSYA